jgi:DNA-binding transcriptional MerR regulator/catechol 2,3-dioxygenase-like lactoylglutathione lyase family enzyme
MLDLSIGEAAARIGVPASTLRYYEKAGLLPPPRRSASGQRRFGEREIQIVEVLRFAQQAGFSLDEIRALFHDYDGAATLGERWHAMALAKLEELAALERRIGQMKAAIEQGLRCGCLRLEDCQLTGQGPASASRNTDASGTGTVQGRGDRPGRNDHELRGTIMELGNFSVSLAVKDIEASRAFYEKLGFTVWGGDQTRNWLIMKNGGTTIGLFQGMFPRNLLTFNPGWDGDARPLPAYTDVRELQRRLREQGVELASEVDETTSGPGSFMVEDPDGNQILFDQHV